MLAFSIAILYATTSLRFSFAAVLHNAPLLNRKQLQKKSQRLWTQRNIRTVQKPSRFATVHRAMVVNHILHHLNES
jgi:hypothetical protein